MRSQNAIVFTMKKSILLFLVCLLGMTSANAAYGKLTMAVNVFGSVDSEILNFVESAFLQRLSGNKAYVVCARNKEFVNKLNQEFDFQTNGSVPVREIRAIGARMGVDYVTLVKVGTFADELTITAEIVNVETGQIIKTVTDSRELEDLDTIKGMANTLAYRLYSKTTR